MSTSTWGGRVRYDDNDLMADDPLGNSLAQAMVNNALHHADQAGQVFVAWPPISGQYMSMAGGSVAAAWYPIATFGPFFPTVGTDGQPYKLRVRLAGYSAAAATLGMRVAYTTLDRAQQSVENNGDDCLDWTGISVGSAWLGGGLLTADPGVVREMAASQVTIDSVGGDPVGVDVLKAYVVVWGRTANTNYAPRLTGLYAAEYVGT